MTKISKFDNEAVDNVSKLVKDSLKRALKEYGLDVEMMSGSYSPADFTVKIKINVKSPEAEKFNKAKEKARWEIYCFKYGLKPEWFGKTFVARSNETFKIIGILPRRPKFPVVCIKVKTGERFKFAPASIKAYMGGK